MEPKAAFQEFVLADLDAAYSYALALAGTRPEAEDLLQEAADQDVNSRSAYGL